MNIDLTEKELRAHLTAQGLVGLPDSITAPDDHIYDQVDRLQLQHPEMPHEAAFSIAVAHYLWTQHPQHRAERGQTTTQPAVATLPVEPAPAPVQVVNYQALTDRDRYWVKHWAILVLLLLLSLLVVEAAKAQSSVTTPLCQYLATPRPYPTSKSSASPATLPGHCVSMPASVPASRSPTT